MEDVYEVEDGKRDATGDSSGSGPANLRWIRQCAVEQVGHFDVTGYEYSTLTLSTLAS